MKADAILPVIVIILIGLGVLMALIGFVRANGLALYIGGFLIGVSTGMAWKDHLSIVLKRVVGDV